MQSILNKISNLEKLIGNTPLIEITFKYKDRPLKIYSKIEYYNYTGSIKDRVALYIIKKWLSPRSLREFNFKYSKRHRTNIGSMLYFSY